MKSAMDGTMMNGKIIKYYKISYRILFCKISQNSI